MKIIFVNSDQFYQLWNKALPSQRITAGIPHPSIVFQHINTMIALREGIEIGSIAEMNEENLSLQRFTEIVVGKKYFEVG